MKWESPVFRGGNALENFQELSEAEKAEKVQMEIVAHTRRVTLSRL
jgi:hypothetical protein